MEKVVITLNDEKGFNELLREISEVVFNYVERLFAIVDEENIDNIVNNYTLSEIISLKGSCAIKSKVVENIEENNASISKFLIAKMVCRDEEISSEKAFEITKKAISDNEGETHLNKYYAAIELSQFIKEIEDL